MKRRARATSVTQRPPRQPRLRVPVTQAKSGGKKNLTLLRKCDPVRKIGSNYF
jgi:hypothetical protein